MLNLGEFGAARATVVESFMNLEQLGGVIATPPHPHPCHPPTPRCLFQPLELLCEKSIGTANRPMGAGEALRRVLECLASGIVMPG